MEFLMEPGIWAGLLTLVVLEIVLGIDNLVFIAILADKLPPEQRDKARLIGLSLALIMRLGLLSVISWMVTLTTPLFWIGEMSFSGRDLILIGGGLFLLFKATVELHERMEGVRHITSNKRVYAGFWVVVAQIVALDAVFSLDAVITAVGMVSELWVMMTAVTIAMAVMLIASKPLTRFVNQHPTVVVLCLSFLLMIGLSLVAEGFGLHIPKGYLYAAIGFSILIETFNQVARHNFLRTEAQRPMRERTAERILQLLGGRTEDEQQAPAAEGPGEVAAAPSFGQEERFMISGVLTLSERSIRSIMTPRSDISWISCNDDPADIRRQLLEDPHSHFPVCLYELDNVIGVVRAKSLLNALEADESLEELARAHAPMFVPETLGVLRLLSTLRHAKGRPVLVTDEYGSLQGLVTPVDLLEAIAGEFPDEDETPDIVTDGEGWLVKGGADLHQVQQLLERHDLVSSEDDYTSLAGFLLARFGDLPEAGEVLHLDELAFEVVEVSERRIELIRVRRSDEAPAA